MQDQDKILYFLRTVGPTLPSKVAKNLNTEILLASAHLSDLAAQGKVKLSRLKVGGSPLYYLPGQEEKLYYFAAGNLNPKDFQVLERLKQEKILRERSLDLLSKVALRSLEDFAVPLHVTIAENKELFWKWHLLSEQETNAGIRALLASPSQEAKPPVEQQQSLPQVLASEQQPIAREIPAEKKKGVEEKKLEVKTPEPAEEPSPKPKPQKKKTVPAADHFIPSVEQYLQERDIAIQEQEIIRKNAEINLLIKVSSVVGKLTYFCKAKKKSKCDEGDISSAYMEAQIKKLPLLFIYTHDLTKKAQEMLATDVFQNAMIKKLEKDG